MRYHAIKGTTAKWLAYAVHPQLADAPTLSPSHHEIFDVTLYTHKQDALNALDKLPHGVAKTCEIVVVDVLPITAPLPA